MNTQKDELFQKLTEGIPSLDKESVQILQINFQKYLKDLILKKNFENANYGIELFKLISELKAVNVFSEIIDPDDLFELITSTFEFDFSEELSVYLEFIRNSNFLKKITDHKKWTNLISKIIKKSNYSVGRLFEDRVKLYGNKTLLNILNAEGKQLYSFNDVNDLQKKYATSLINLLKNSEQKTIGFLLENSIEMAILDIACLLNGIKNVMIPSNTVPEHIEYILNSTKISFLFVHDEKQLEKLRVVKKKLKFLQGAVILKGNAAENWVITFDEFLNIEEKSLFVENQTINIEAPATVMFTSGTTGTPKGIVFSNLNIVFKRFCRAIAIPEIGENDRFLSYLPLYHTFGRYLELFGAIFWGAEYVFMENPSLEAMLKNMQQAKPSVFISIPKKWIQIYEFIESKIDLMTSEPEKIKDLLNHYTGGNLKYGLSAAGYLPSEVFIFFRTNNIELMSGFGMTEATGGITMTPPGKFKNDTLGVPLPGIDVKLAEDGEMLIKGDYVMKEYFGNDSKDSFDSDGWFHTGDIMTQDKDGYYIIIDRKKEIYKNIRGETIAPQKIENYFNEFPFIKQVFLVGDHRPFNTVLIYPNEEELKNGIAAESSSDIFSSAVVSVNKFLAPFERILDYRIIDRAFLAEKGELTPKNTFKRRVIENNFSNLIDEMYKKNYISLNFKDIEIRIPEWFLREKGCLNRDILILNNKISIPKLSKNVSVSVNNNKLRIGDYIYSFSDNRFDLQQILVNPFYWAGNIDFFNFAGDSLIQWQRSNNDSNKLKIIEKAAKIIPSDSVKQKFVSLSNHGEISLKGLNIALHLIQSTYANDAYLGLDYLKTVLQNKNSSIYYTAINFLFHPQLADSLPIKRELLKLSLKFVLVDKLDIIFCRYLTHKYDIIDEDTIDFITVEVSDKSIIEIIEKVCDSFSDKFKINKDENNLRVISSLLDLLSNYGIHHPTSYERIRQILVKYQLNSDGSPISEIAYNFRLKMREGFRKWLGDNEIIAVDIETGEEYSWNDVVIFEDSIPENDKKLLLKSISKTPLIRESLFLFSKGKLIRLHDILPGGIWVSYLREHHDKIVYRLTIQTRIYDSFDIVVNLNKKLSNEKVKEEIGWLILAGSRHYVDEMVEDFGGFWEESEIWTGKFSPGLTVLKFIQKEVKKKNENNDVKIKNLWPFFVWNAAAAFFNFWKLTGYKLFLYDTSPENFIIPGHDYQTGTKVVSFSERETAESICKLLHHFYNRFVTDTQDLFPFLRNENIINLVFAGLINAEGEKEGLNKLSKIEQEICFDDRIQQDYFKLKLNEFIQTIKNLGFMPKPLYFAIKRFHRWYSLNMDASAQAQAETIQYLYNTYHLIELEENYPETRTRFFFETVFSNSKDDIKRLLFELINEQRTKKIEKNDFIFKVSKIKTEIELSSNEEYFIARLSYPYLQPEDDAALEEISNAFQATPNLLVQYEDFEGNPFIIRRPINPKEISKLHKLFIEASLNVKFLPEHEFLVAISERGHIIGGLFYIIQDRNTAYMDKIVVSERFRRKGISDKLMNELFNRLKNNNIKYVITGFFRPEYFYKFNFKVERKYSGLVKKLF